jgi:hypothetical protein
LEETEINQSYLPGQEAAHVDTEYTRVVRYARECLRLATKEDVGINHCLNYFPGGISADSVPMNKPSGDNYHIDVVDDPDPFFGDRWSDKEARIRKFSRIGHLPGWRLLPVIIKSGDDLRQEQFASYMIKQMHEIYEQCGVDCWMRPYDVVAMSPDSGIIEVHDYVSLIFIREIRIHHVGS